MKVIISGGGTGGHIFPALSIAGQIKKTHPDAEILFVGALGRMEMERVPAAGYKIVGLPVAGFNRQHLLRNWKFPFLLWRSMRRAAGIIRDFRPDVAIGVGGYASGPVLKAAQRRGIPTLIQEQNQYPGVTNKILAKRARCICTAYGDMERFFDPSRTVLTGNPIRPELTQCALTQAQAKEALGFSPDKPLVLSVGGSLGARTVNNAVAEALPLLKDKDINLLWQTGKIYADACMAKARLYGNVKAQAFITDMATAYRAADLVVSRAGAGTISELQLVGAAVVLIPSPNVAEDHQRKNAMALAYRKAAVMIEDAGAVAALGNTIVRLIADAGTRAAMSAQIRRMALPDAAARIVEQIDKIVES